MSAPSVGSSSSVSPSSETPSAAKTILVEYIKDHWNWVPSSASYEEESSILADNIIQALRGVIQVIGERGSCAYVCSLSHTNVNLAKDAMSGILHIVLRELLHLDVIIYDHEYPEEPRFEQIRRTEHAFLLSWDHSGNQNIKRILETFLATGTVIRTF